MVLQICGRQFFENIMAKGDMIRAQKILLLYCKEISCDLIGELAGNIYIMFPAKNHVKQVSHLSAP